MAKHAKNLWQQVRQGAASLTYGNPLYRYMLQGQVPEHLQFMPQYYPSGDAALGERLCAGQFIFAHDSSHCRYSLDYNRISRYFQGQYQFCGFL